MKNTGWLTNNVIIGLNGCKLDEMDYLRGFSILTVVLMHLSFYFHQIPEMALKIAGIGGTGVHAFFLCSGIGLYLSYEKRKMTYVQFLKRRFSKIYLPYIIIVLISFFIPWMYKKEDRVAALMSHVFLYKMFIPEYEESFGVHFWFISTIIQFYFLFIPLYRIMKRCKNNKVFGCIMLLISVIWWCICWLLGLSEIRIFKSFFLQYLWEFALGMILADKLLDGKKLVVTVLQLIVFATVGMALQLVMALSSESLKLFNDIPALVGYISLALLVMKFDFIRQICIKISDFSFEFYLVHIIVFSSVFHFIRPYGIEIQFPGAILAFVLAVIIGYLYHVQCVWIGKQRTR